MARAFLIHLVGFETAEKIRGIIEASVVEQDEDEFAEFWDVV